MIMFHRRLKNMVYDDEALKNIICDNIRDKEIVWIASQLYCGWNQKDNMEDLENELTKHLLNKEYSRPRPIKPPRYD